MDSLKVGKEIYSLLNGNDSLTGVVGSKIYPIIVEKETTYPFIVLILFLAILRTSISRMK